METLTFKLNIRENRTTDKIQVRTFLKKKSNFWVPCCCTREDLFIDVILRRIRTKNVTTLLFLAVCPHLNEGRSDAGARGHHRLDTFLVDHEIAH